MRHVCFTLLALAAILLLSSETLASPAEPTQYPPGNVPLTMHNLDHPRQK